MGKVQKKRKINPLKKFAWFGILLLLAFMVLFIFLQKGEVTITGCNYYTEEEIKEKLFEGVMGDNVLLFYLKNQYFEKVSIPFVQEIDVELITLHKIKVTVYEKAIVACVKYMSEYLYFDKDGIIVESSEKKVSNVPLITGVHFSSMTLQKPLAVEDDTIFEKILNLSQSISQYKLKVSEVAFNYRQEVTLISGGIRVLLGKRDFYDDQIAELSKMLPKAQKNHLKGELHMENFEEGQDKIIFNSDS